MVYYSPSPVENTTITDIKGLRDYALVLLGLNTSHSLEDIAALRWSDLQIGNGTVTIHWRHPHGHPRNERLTHFVSGALLHYLHALHGTALATLEPDTPLWLGLRRIDDRMMLSTRTIKAIFREHLDKTQTHLLQ